MKKAVILNEKDNVAVALENLKPGERIELNIGERTVEITIKDSIPVGHKFAVEEIGKGDKVIKYGEQIAIATKKIHVGEHVHIHNIGSYYNREILREKYGY